MRTIGHFIGGREVKGISGRTANVFEPMTGEVQAKVDLASKAEVRAAVENAKTAQAEWGEGGRKEVVPPPPPPPAPG
jgi:malonate-semialdehyde dehydrogenase (acetylating) / methylmalonate-semialdehyde dehydrogenase